MAQKQAQKRKLFNVRSDDEFMAAVGELQRADTSSPTPPSGSDVVRKAVFEARDRLRKREPAKK